MKQFLYPLIFFSAVLMSSWSLGQNRSLNPELAAIARSSTSPAWIHFREGMNLNPLNLFEDQRRSFQLGPDDQMRLEKTNTDALGFTHYHYQFHYQQLPVEGAEFIVHAKNGIAIKANGHLPPHLNLSTTPAIEANQALQLALAHMGARVYMWEFPGNDAALQHAQKDPTATFFPQPELLIVDSDFDPAILDYRLAWKMELYAAEPHSKKWIYVNAMDGSIMKELETLHTINSVGTAVTKYHGIRSIVTDSVDNQFRLRESKRGADSSYVGVDIETYDMNQSLSYGDAVDFVDGDNYWDNVNPELDEAATDAHWGAELTHDFFWETYGLSSFDGMGTAILSYIHFDTAYFNAF